MVWVAISIKCHAALHEIQSLIEVQRAVNRPRPRPRMRVEHSHAPATSWLDQQQQPMH